MTTAFLVGFAFGFIATWEAVARRRVERELRRVKARNVALETELHWLNHTHPLERD